MTLLSDRTIRYRMEPLADPRRRIILTNCDVDRDIRSCSVHVYLGATMKIWTGSMMDPRSDNSEFWKPIATQEYKGDKCWWVQPGSFYLGVMSQRLVLPHDVAGNLTGNSTEGRCGIVIHQTAGHFDPGYDGYGTFEITVAVMNTILWAGMRIGQFTFSLLDQEVENPYNGRYQGDTEAQPAKLLEVDANGISVVRAGLGIVDRTPLR